MTVIIGIDPGIGKTGWAIIERLGRGAKAINLLASGLIKTDTTAASAVRLRTIHDQLQLAINEYGAEQAAIEDSFVNKNPRSSLKLSQARGAIILSLNLAGLSVAEYTPTAVKSAIVGSGRADKAEVARMLTYLITIPTGKPLASDVSDALGVAIAHSRLSE